MHITLSRYAGVAGKIGEAAPKVQQGFAPLLKGQQGFMGYAALASEQGDNFACTIWENGEAAANARPRIRIWLNGNLKALRSRSSGCKAMLARMPSWSRRVAASARYSPFRTPVAFAALTQPCRRFHCQNSESEYHGCMDGNRNEAPRERAPCLLVFGDLAPRVAKLVRARPILIARLILAPREAVHAIGAFLHLAPEAARPDGEVAELINDTDPRILLRTALPDCPRHLYRALDSAGDRVLAKRFYERLGATCRGLFADALLDGDLTEGRIAYYEALSKMDPATAALRIGFRENTYVVDSVNCMVSLLRAHGVLRDEEMRLPAGAGMPAVARRIRTALGRIEAPESSYCLASGYFVFVSSARQS